MLLRYNIYDKSSINKYMCKRDIWYIHFALSRINNITDI